MQNTSPAPRPILELRNVVKDYGTFKALHEIEFSVSPGSFVAVVGPSGCGKSTLLRSIAGLESISSGQIVIDGMDVTHMPAAQRGLAMVFQSYALYPHKTVRENMAFALKIAKRPKAEIDEKVAEAARALKLEHLLDRLPKQLSGGQRQRVAIGRAIVREPKAFLFDEPLSNLDAALRTETRVELAELHKRLGATMIYVTHDQVEAMTLADEIIILEGGYIRQIGSPKQLYTRPASKFVAGFIGSPRMNFIDGQMSGGQFVARGVVMALPGIALDGPVTLGLRPEVIKIGDRTQRFGTATVTMIEYLGDECVVHAKLADDTPLVLRERAELDLSEGSQIALRVDGTEAVHIFDPEDGRRLNS